MVRRPLCFSEPIDFAAVLSLLEVLGGSPRDLRHLLVGEFKGQLEIDTVLDL